MKPGELIGKQFGRITVIQLSHVKFKKRYWLCCCVCGGSTVTTTQKLKSGHTKSCGCLAREVSKSNRLKETRHGHARAGKASRTYITWQSMNRRCNNEKHKDYSKYGLVGITVCNEWLNFENFLLEMGERPNNTTIDRIDANLGYMKSNCRWASPTVQSRNIKLLKLTLSKATEIRNDHRPQTVIAKEFGISQSCVSKIKRNKLWSNSNE